MTTLTWLLVAAAIGALALAFFALKPKKDYDIGYTSGEPEIDPPAETKPVVETDFVAEVPAPEVVAPAPVETPVDPIVKQKRARKVAVEAVKAPAKKAPVKTAKRAPVKKPTASPGQSFTDAPAPSYRQDDILTTAVAAAAITTVLTDTTSSYSAPDTSLSYDSSSSSSFDSGSSSFDSGSSSGGDSGGGGW